MCARAAAERSGAHGADETELADEGGDGDLWYVERDYGTRVGADHAGERASGFSLRGLVKVKTGWALVCVAHNLLKMHRGCYG
jgi:hypothetical protein